MNIAHLSIGKRIAVLVTAALSLLLLLSIASFLALRDIGTSVESYSRSVTWGNTTKDLENQINVSVAAVSEYLVSPDVENSQAFSDSIAKTLKILNDLQDVDNAVIAEKQVSHLKDLTDQFETVFRQIVAENQGLQRINSEEIFPRLRHVEDAIHARLQAAQDEGDIGGSFESAMGLTHLAKAEARLGAFAKTPNLEYAAAAREEIAKVAEIVGNIHGQLEELASFDATLVDAEMLGQVAALPPLVKEVDAAFAKAQKHALEAQRLRTESLNVIVPNSLQLVERLAEGLTGYQQELAEGAESTRANSGTLLWIVSGAGLFVGIALSTWMATGMTRQIRGVTVRLENSALHTQSASSQIMSSSNELARGANIQASSLQETSASLEEMTGMTSGNAERAQDAKGLAGETRNAAERGAKDMKEMTEAMQAIKDSSNNIAKIIRTIDEIAFQTNLLALNAAVEAARAGESGAGFAVVADEVRSLAHRSAEAARETAVKIEDSLQKSDRGVEICKLVDESLHQIVDRARSVDSLVVEIADSSQEQSAGIKQIEKAISEIDTMTQQNAATAEENSSASEMLNEQANVMEQAVRHLSKLVGMRRRADTDDTLSDTAQVTEERGAWNAPQREVAPPGGFVSEDFSTQPEHEPFTYTSESPVDRPAPQLQDAADEAMPEETLSFDTPAADPSGEEEETLSFNDVPAASGDDEAEELHFDTNGNGKRD